MSCHIISCKLTTVDSLLPKGKKTASVGGSLADANLSLNWDELSSSASLLLSLNRILLLMDSALAKALAETLWLMPS